MLNSKLVSGGPQHPAHGREPKPEQPSLLAQEIGGYSTKVNNRGRRPVNRQPRSDAAPKKLSQVAVKEHIVGIFPSPT